MRKIWKIIIGAAAVLSLAACSPTTNKSAKTESQVSPQETQVKEVVEKLPDADAPELELVSIYYPNEDGTGLKQVIDGVEEVTAQSLVDMLIQYGVLDEGTKVLDFKTEGESSEQLSGPGESTVIMVYSNAVLNLSQIPENADKLLLTTAIANTFNESMNIQELTIQVNGEEYASGLTFTERFDKLK